MRYLDSWTVPNLVMRTPVQLNPNPAVKVGVIFCRVLLEYSLSTRLASENPKHSGTRYLLTPMHGRENRKESGVITKALESHY